MKSDIRERIDTARTAETQPGPQTPEAKARVRWNSYQHGLTGQLVQLSPEEQPFFDRIAEGFRSRFQPGDEFEQQLVQKLIDDNWRLNSCAALENSLFTQGGVQHGVKDSRWDPAMEHIITRAITWQEKGQSFERLGRYETHIHRRFQQNLITLEYAQTMRRAAAELTTQPQDKKPVSGGIDLFRKMKKSAPPIPAHPPRQPASSTTPGLSAAAAPRARPLVAGSG